MRSCVPDPYLPQQQFHVLLTLYPESFSTFPHGTCLLSVLCVYLALEGTHLPYLRTTLKVRDSRITVSPRYYVPTRLLLSMALHIRETLKHKTDLNDVHTPQLHKLIRQGIQDALFPLHSQLLRESLLISFPPHIDMLKFRGL